jgi:TPR repeat protein
VRSGNKTGIAIATIMAIAVAGAGARADSESNPRDIPLVGALADRAEVEAKFKIGVEAYDRGDYAVAYDAWLPLAQTGDPAAQRNIGHLYRNGLGVQQDFPLAAEWYRRAADAGLARAQANLAMMYLRGQGILADPTQAAFWFEAAAAQGHVIAQYNLGLMHLRGVGMPRSEPKAIAWLYRASKAGHEKSLETLSQVLAGSSSEVASDSTKPSPSPNERQVSSNDNANRPVRNIVVQNSEPKVISVQDQHADEAAADEGSESAPRTITVGDLLKNENEDETEAYEQGDRQGRQVGRTYSYGENRAQSGVPRPVTVARIDTSGRRSASRTGVAERNSLPNQQMPSEVAIAAAAIATNNGDYGIAMERLRPLAEANDAEAQYMLAHLHLNRSNNKGDPASGYYWLARAELAGHPKAQTERTRLDMALERDALFRGRQILQRWQRGNQ